VREGTVTRVGPDHLDDRIGSLLQMESVGTESFDLLDGLLSQFTNVGSLGSKPDERGMNFLLAVVQGTEPRDQVEAMLAAPMAGVHVASMTMARRLAGVDTIPQQDSAELPQAREALNTIRESGDLLELSAADKPLSARRRCAQHNSTSPDTITAVRHLVRTAADDLMAGSPKRNRLGIGHGDCRTRECVTAPRCHHRISVYRPAPDGSSPGSTSRGWLRIPVSASRRFGCQHGATRPTELQRLSSR
jgi:hypothetical protein